MMSAQPPWEKPKGNIAEVLGQKFQAGSVDQAKPEKKPEAGPGSMMDYALRYAARGWPVFPLHTWLGNGCSCGHLACTSPGKHPRTRSGFLDASTDPAQIREWWDRWPNANIGVPMGKVSGVWALDVDVKHGVDGRETLDQMLSEHGALPDTLMQMTGGGGIHHVFEYTEPVRNRGRFAPGLDVRGDGGYIAVEPSSHESGANYAWEAESDPLDGVAALPAPEWLLALVRSTQGAKSVPAAGTHTDRIPEGGRNNALASLAGTLRRHGVGQEAIEAALQAENARRCDPPLPSIDVQTIAWSVARYEPAHDYGIRGLVDLSGFLGERQEQGFRLTPAHELAGNIRAPEWLIKGLIERASFAVLFGPPAAGKTFLALSMAMAIADGRAFFNFAPRQQGPVIYLAGEGHGGIGRRLRAYQIHHGGDLPRNLYVSSIAAPMMDPAGIVQVREAIAGIVEQHGAPALLVVDTLARHLVPGDENSNEDMGRFVSVLDQIRDQLQCAVLVVHHTGHGNGKRARGASALPGAADFMFSAVREQGGLCRFSAHPDDGGKTKDCEPPEAISYQIEAVDLGLVDEDGDAITSAVPVLVDAPARADKAKRKMTPAQQAVYDALLLAIREEGQEFKAAGAKTVASPQGLCVRFDRWRHWAYRTEISSEDAGQDARRMAFKRAVDALKSAGAVQHIDSFFWPSDQADLQAATLVRNQVFGGLE